MSLATVIVDDFSSMLAYSGTWTAPDTSAVGYPGSDAFLLTLVDGTYHETSATNSSVSLNFTGPSISLYGVAGPTSGFYNVRLDSDATTAPLSAFAAANASDFLLWSVESLSNEPHTVTLTNLGSNGNASVGETLLLDYAAITSIVAAGSSLTNTTIDDRGSGLIYSGNWTSNNDTRFYGNTSTYSDEQGATVTLNFHGSAVYLFGDTVDDHGYFTAQLDNTSYTYDAETADLHIGTLKFFAGDLTSAEHQLVITNDGAGTYFDIDYIVYTTPSTYAAANTSSSSSPSGSSNSSGTSTAASSSSSGTAAAKSGSTTTKFAPYLLASGLVLVGLAGSW